MKKNKIDLISYAQNFEDIILERIFAHQSDGFYVDIGACHPIHDSVTQHFYQRGWQGINIEPQPLMYAELQQVRQRDINLNICVGSQTDRKTLYITHDQGTSTLDETLADGYQKADRIAQKIDVEIVSLNEIWATYVGERRVDFLKIDVEGFEKEVLAGTDFSVVAPSILLIEAVRPDTHKPDHLDWEPLISDHYQLFYFDGLNRFYYRNGYPIDLSRCGTPPNVFDQFKTYREYLAEQSSAHFSAQAKAARVQITNLKEWVDCKDAALLNATESYKELRSQFEETLNALQLAEKERLELLASVTKPDMLDEPAPTSHAEAGLGTCIFTIVSNNYLHYANTLFESLKEHAPEADLILGLCDLITADTNCPLADDLIPIKSLDIPQLSTFIYQYSILELNTAIKPYIIEVLMKRGYQKIIYFDPDIQVFHSLGEMIGLLDQYNVLLTPHLTNILDDEKTPTELQILQAGSYNLGYIALRSCEECQRLVKWWQKKLYKGCVVDLTRSLFVDQKWMDLVPSMFEGVFINRNPGWNIAYWNLNHRNLEQQHGTKFIVDGHPLTFFHFSGFSTNSNTLSKHQNRFNKNSSAPLQALCNAYELALLRNGLEHFQHLPYAFSHFADGTLIPDSARRLIRTWTNHGDINFFDTQHCARIHAELNRTVPSGPNGLQLTALALALWESRKDLREAFPAVENIDSQRFAEWVIESASREAGFSEVYLQPIRKELERTEHTSDRPSSLITRISNSLFRFIWQQRRRIPLNLRIALAPYAGWALKKAYSRLEQSQPTVSNEPGINLIGYLNAESGVGEAARASLRALHQSDLPYSLVDYRVGNISRMGEDIGKHINQAWYPINLLHVNADQCKLARDYLGSSLFRDRYTIGYWYWELPEFPDFLHFAYEQVNEIWVSSEYNRKSIEKYTDKPVCIVPPAIEVKITVPLSRSELHLPTETFIFLHISDVLSIPQRKNPLGVIEAFRLAFGDMPDAKVKLVIKLSNLDHQPALSEAIFAAMHSEPRIQLIHEYLDRNTLNNLLNACDCYVSLHRAEGFGLPIAEAMYLSKPVIATNWSGNVDFMSEKNSLPVAYQMITLEEDFGPYKKGQVWAEPCLKDAAHKMRSLLSDKEKSTNALNELGELARATIRSMYNPKLTAAKMQERVNHICPVKEH